MFDVTKFDCHGPALDHACFAFMIALLDLPAPASTEKVVEQLRLWEKTCSHPDFTIRPKRCIIMGTHLILGNTDRVLNQLVRMGLVQKQKKMKVNGLLLCSVLTTLQEFNALHVMLKDGSILSNFEMSYRFYPHDLTREDAERGFAERSLDNVIVRYFVNEEYKHNHHWGLLLYFNAMLSLYRNIPPCPQFLYDRFADKYVGPENVMAEVQAVPRQGYRQVLFFFAALLSQHAVPKCHVIELGKQRKRYKKRCHEQTYLSMLTVIDAKVAEIRKLVGQGPLICYHNLTRGFKLSRRCYKDWFVNGVKNAFVKAFVQHTLVIEFGIDPFKWKHRSFAVLQWED